MLADQLTWLVETPEETSSQGALGPFVQMLPIRIGPKAVEHGPEQRQWMLESETEYGISLSGQKGEHNAID